MRKAKKLGLVGRVVFGVGALGGLVSMSGCDAVVGGYVGAKIANMRNEKRVENENGVSHKYWSVLKIYKNTDLDGDNKVDRLGEIDSPVNPKRTGIDVSYISSNVFGSVDYVVIDSDDNVIGRTTVNYVDDLSTTNGYSSDNCLDKMVRNGDGEYTIVASRGADIISKKVVINNQN